MEVFVDFVIHAVVDIGCYRMKRNSELGCKRVVFWTGS